MVQERSGLWACWASLPRDRAVTVLLRHAERDEPSHGREVPADAPLTSLGRDRAEQLGFLMADELRSLRCSPVLRCRQTADAIFSGARPREVLSRIDDRYLGDPGVFIIDEEGAGRNWQRLGVAGVNRHFMQGEGNLPGMAPPEMAAPKLIRHMFECAGSEVGLHVFVTHDYLVGATARYCLGEKLSDETWPGFLECVVLWQENDGVCFRYQGRQGHLPGLGLQNAQ